MVPQLVKIFREKKPAEISYVMMFVLLAGLGMWIWYGLKKEDWLIVCSNSFAFSVNLLTIFLNLYYKKNGAGS